MSPPHTSADLFTSPTGDWTSVSPALATVRGLIGTAAGAALVLASALLWLFLAELVDPWQLTLAIPAVIGVGVVCWVWWWAPRNRRSWGYTEAGSEFVVRGGIMFRRLVVVPYGRMQFVDVESGPIARYFGFGTLTLHTASTQTAAAIPGVPLEEARRLRNRLTELGESNSAGV